MLLDELQDENVPRRSRSNAEKRRVGVSEIREAAAAVGGGKHPPSAAGGMETLTEAGGDTSRLPG